MKEKNQENNFKTPDGYFESFNERLKQRLDEEMEAESGIIPKTDGFAIPEKYFETFSVRPPVSKVIPLHKYRKFYAVAASIAAIVLLTFVFIQNKDQKIGFEDLASAEIDAYFETNGVDLSSEELAEVVNLEDVSILDITETENTIEDDMILEYLNENVDEVEELNLDYDEFE